MINSVQQNLTFSQSKFQYWTLVFQSLMSYISYHSLQQDREKDSGPYQAHDCPSVRSSEGRKRSNLWLQLHPHCLTTVLTDRTNSPLSSCKGSGWSLTELIGCDSPIGACVLPADYKSTSELHVYCSPQSTILSQTHEESWLLIKAKI